MRRYKHIFFDLDHTLWDFDKNCSETLSELYLYYELSKSGVDLEKLIITYKEVNEQMWVDFNIGKINKEQIRSNRFEITFEKMGFSKKYVPSGINDEFMKICPSKGNVIPFA